MRRKYLVGPILCSLACWTFGNGIAPLLPLYAVERGASRAASGLFFAFAFLCLALGTFAAAILPKAFPHRKPLLVTSGVLLGVLSWLQGNAANVLQLAATTGPAWFLAGIVFSQSATLVGLAAKPEDRGAAFGIYGMTSGLGSLIGGFGVGYIADRFGYRSVFASLAVVFVLVVVGGLVSIEPPAAPSLDSRGRPGIGRGKVGIVFVLLLVAELFAAVANAAGVLGRSLAMDAGGFGKLAITLTASIAGLVSLGFPAFMGWLSDRVGRRWILVASYAATGAGLLVLAFARSMWQFCAFAVLNAFLNVAWAVGPAYIVDIVPKESVDRSVSLFQTLYWLGNVAGMACAGFAFARLGLAIPLFIASLFPATGAVLLLFAREKTRRAENAGGLP
jgi:MFS family permease